MKTGINVARGCALAVSLAVSAAPMTGWAHGTCRSINAYVQRNLVSDDTTVNPAEHKDTDLVNAWGIAINPFGGPFWVADNGTGVSTLYDGNGIKQGLVVTIPPAPGEAPPSNPTGVVFNGSMDFVIGTGATRGPARFIFVTESGTLAAWSPTLSPVTEALLVPTPPTGAIYKGVALAGTGTGLHLYATDFHNARIDVFDSSFAPVTLDGGSFTDPAIPAGYAPFGIQNILGNLYVTYAKQDADKEDDVPGKGFGFVDVYDANGHLLRRLISHGRLNAPWGLALAPEGFGKFSNRLLVGNFGDGTINAFDIDSGESKGPLLGKDGMPIHIDGLWGLSFGNGVLNQPTNTLFFTSGPDDEAHGLYGRLDLPTDCVPGP